MQSTGTMLVNETASSDLVSNVESRDLTRFAGDTALADLPDELFGQDKSPVPALVPQWALDGKGAPFAVSQLVVSYLAYRAAKLVMFPLAIPPDVFLRA